MISLFAAEERTTKRDRLGDPLKVLDQAIDFAALAEAVDAKLVIGDSGRGGRPPYPTELMIRLLVVQQLYNLSDDALEYQMLDRASFQRFAGLEKSGRIPDAKTIWVWRERLKKQDLIGDISEAVGLQLAQAGFIARGGQIIDASIVTAPGPLFILCLIFDQTKELFRRWLLYGIGTLFSIAVLCVVSSIVLKLTVNVAAALWSASVVNSITGLGAEGFSSQALQQGGIGLLLTVLIISVPPLAAAFFQGTVGQFMHFSAFGGGFASRPGPQGQPPGSYGRGYASPAFTPTPASQSQQKTPTFSQGQVLSRSTASASNQPPHDLIKSANPQNTRG